MNYIERYWRDATPADAIKEPPMVARFRYEYCPDWVIDKLIYWDRSETPWHREDGFCYDLCQVYDAPDPGEGWRLIDIDNEKPQAGDECFFRGFWRYRNETNDFIEKYHYRRRVTPAVTYVPFTWEDREQLRGRWIGSNDGRCQRSINTIHNDNGIFYLCAINAELLCTDWHFIDTGEPVGKKVAQ